MKLSVRAFLATFVAFLFGAVVGFAVIVLGRGLSDLVSSLLEARMLTPVRSATSMGEVAVFGLIFANNSVSVLLAFLYPLLIAKIHWSPKLSLNREKRLLSYFSVLAGFLLGVFDLGSILGLSVLTGGVPMFSRLVSRAWLHAPMEFGLVILALSEPLSLARRLGSSGELALRIREDWLLLVVCLVGLAISAFVEVFLAS